jgi:hypothetical protein
MKWTFDHSQMPVCVRVDVEGDATLEGTFALWNEIITSDAWHPGMSVLLDITNLSQFGGGGSQIMQKLIGYFIEHREEIGKSCIAIVRPNPEVYNYGRQFEYGIRLRGSAVVVRNFLNVEHASEWLANNARLSGGVTEISTTGASDRL